MDFATVLMTFGHARVMLAHMRCSPRALERAGSPRLGIMETSFAGW